MWKAVDSTEAITSRRIPQDTDYGPAKATNQQGWLRKGSEWATWVTGVYQWTGNGRFQIMSTWALLRNQQCAGKGAG